MKTHHFLKSGYKVVVNPKFKISRFPKLTVRVLYWDNFMIFYPSEPRCLQYLTAFSRFLWILLNLFEDAFQVSFELQK